MRPNNNAKSSQQQCGAVGAMRRFAAVPQSRDSGLPVYHHQLSYYSVNLARARLCGVAVA